MSEDKRPKNNVDLKKYDDPTGLSAKNLDFGFWLANNRRKIYKIIIIILAIFAGFFSIYSIYSYIHFFTIGAEQEKILSQDTSGVDLVNYRLQNTPLNLQTGEAWLISQNTGSDFVTTIKNPNDKQFASFDFCFVSGENRACGSDFILPNQEKNVLLINHQSKQLSGRVDFEMSNIKWQKIKAGDIPDWNAYQSERVKFVISEPKFVTYEGGISYLEFDIDNQSAYSYFEIPLNIIISRGSEILAVNRYTVKDLNSRQKKSVSLRWTEAADLGGTIKIVADLNIINPGIYKAYRSN